PPEARPRATHELLRWDRGRLVLTPPHGGIEPSLALMRQIMVRWPRLIAAVFIGGMDGIWNEAKTFMVANREGGHGPRPCYAIASTGAAAADLLKPEWVTEERAGARDVRVFAGTGTTRDERLMLDLLRRETSYPLVMWRIFTELGLA